MYYKRIPKEKSIQPKSGHYNSPTWKEQIAKECFGQCVYCAIHEGKFGGLRNYHIDHFKPKSIFDKLVNDIKNLFLACSICNCFKKDDWPTDPQFRFPNPSKIDYSTIFKREKDYKITGKNLSAKYLIEKLFLNRPQLIFERREFFLQEDHADIMNKIAKLKAKALKLKNVDEKRLIKIISDIDDSKTRHIELRNELSTTSPYRLQDITK